MKKKVFILLILCAVGFYVYPQDRLPGELAKMELQLLEIKAQLATLDNYSPEKLLDFAELEKINRFVEQLDFSKRRFELLIKQFNLFEDEIFPFLLRLSGQSPNLRNEIVKKIAEYSGQEEKSVLKIQNEINRTALHIERLEKKIERAQTSAREKDIAETEKQKASDSEKTMNISSRIQKLAEEQKNYLEKLALEKQRLKKLKENEKYQENKIVEKNNEVIALRKETQASKDIVKKRINDILAAVKEMRINGLEIPRLNTARTFIYLSETARATLEGKIENLKKEIGALENIRVKELRDRLIKGVIIIVFAVLLVFVLNRAARRISRRIIDRVEKSQKVDAHRKQRYQTLSSVILSFIRILSWILAVLWVLGELNIDYAPFLVAAGGISLAIGFGAQSLVKDVVSGFFILMEEQFALGDYVEIEGKSGTIEKISMRTVQFRSLDGVLHIVPNGAISSVSNSTHQWSRAVVKVSVSYDADAEHVLAVLTAVCRQMYHDPRWQSILIDEPIAQGIISFAASAVEFRILAKTAAGEQWAVEREFKIRIQKTFKQEGIDIPYNIVDIIDHSSKKRERRPRPQTGIAG